MITKYEEKYEMEEILLQQIALKLNEKNINELENGLVYDFLIRLLTNIRLPIHQQAQILSGTTILNHI